MVRRKVQEYTDEGQGHIAEGQDTLPKVKGTLPSIALKDVVHQSLRSAHKGVN